MTHSPATQIGAWLRTVFSWLILLVVLALVSAAVVVPRVAGATPYTVLTTSMRPSYPPGTLIVIRPVPADRLAVGDAITYQLESGKPEVVTHRIVGISYAADGQTTYRTQGDHNASPDKEPVLPAQVRGKVWYAVPYVGFANTWLTGARRSAAVGVGVIILTIYALWMFSSAAADKRRERRGTASTTGGNA